MKTVGEHTAAAATSSKLNLGSGEDYRDGWVNLDINERYDPDVVHDLNDGWPFPDNSFQHILAQHVFEHLDDPFYQFAEAERCLQPGGRLEVVVPLGINAKTDMTHQHEWTYDSPLQFASNWRELCRPGDYQFDPQTELCLVDRAVSLVGHGPLRIMGPLGEWLFQRNPGVWVSGWPGTSGELTAVYRLGGEP